MLKETTPEAIKYNAYTALGFKPYEHQYFDNLFAEIVKINNLSKEDNPLDKEYANSAKMIEAIEVFLQKYALRTGERTDMKPPNIELEVSNNLKDIFYHLGMVSEIEPSYKVYDAVLCMGAPEVGVRSRVSRLAEILRGSDINIKNIVILGAERKLWPLKKTGDKLSFPEPVLYNILAERLSLRDGREITLDEVKQKVLSLHIRKML